MHEGAPLHPSSGQKPRSPVHPRDRYRGAFRISLGISALLHVLAISLYPSFFSGIPEAGQVFGGYLQPLTPAGTEIVNLVELPADQDPENLPPPEEEPEIETPIAPATVRPLGLDAPSGLDALHDRPAAPSAAEALRPRRGDLRYWAPVSEERTALTEEEILRLRFIAELEAVNDSAALAEQRAADAMDWTYTDEDGKRWGVSPGKLHLGDLTLPMPFGFGTSPAQRERAEDRLWAWDEIQQSAATGAVRNSWKERDKAIRERMNAQRRADTTGTGGGGRGGG
jgi:hypothetical protein